MRSRGPRKLSFRCGGARGEVQAMQARIVSVEAVLRRLARPELDPPSESSLHGPRAGTRRGQPREAFSTPTGKPRATELEMVDSAVACSSRRSVGRAAFDLRMHVRVAPDTSRGSGRDTESGALRSYAALAWARTRNQFSPVILRTFSGVVIRLSAATRPP